MTYRIIYKVTWPNGRIYVGSDFTDSISYFGTPTKAQIEVDFPSRASRQKITVTREILWESPDIGAADLRRKEREYIIALRANGPEIGYNLRPLFRAANGKDAN